MSGWVRFENTTPEDPDLPALSDRAFRLWFNAICYCSRAESDGMVPTVLIPSLSVSGSKKVVAELLGAGLLIDRGEKIEVRNYLKFNPSKAQLQDLREKARVRTSRWRNNMRSDGVTTHVTDSIRRTDTDSVTDVVDVDSSTAVVAGEGDAPWEAEGVPALRRLLGGDAA